VIKYWRGHITEEWIETATSTERLLTNIDARQGEDSGHAKAKAYQEVQFLKGPYPTIQGDAVAGGGPLCLGKQLHKKKGGLTGGLNFGGRTSQRQNNSTIYQSETGKESNRM